MLNDMPDIVCIRVYMHAYTYIGLIKSNTKIAFNVSAREEGIGRSHLALNARSEIMDQRACIINAESTNLQNTKYYRAIDG